MPIPILAHLALDAQEALFCAVVPCSCCLQRCVANCRARARAIDKKAAALIDAIQLGPAQPVVDF